MKLPVEAIQEYQDICLKVFKTPISFKEASISAEALLTLMFSLENNGYKQLLNNQKNGTKNLLPNNITRRT
ncbi:MAG: hypothetical protein ACD_19C00012G0002 [uncultured bacterium]|nr:MAG: hypothetical protein ACD_19C00012G0002 [uncultured bacterium]